MNSILPAATIAAAVALGTSSLAAQAQSKAARNLEQGLSTTTEITREIVRRAPVPVDTVDDYVYSLPPEPPQPPVHAIDYDAGLPDRPPTGPVVFEIDPGGSVSLDYMAGYIDTVLPGNVVGYAYVINQDGNPARQNAWGYARTVDDGLLDMSVHTRSQIASITKQITAVTAIKILDEAGISVDAAISPYLPDDWVQGLGFAGLGVTFRQLLTHRTGLNQLFEAMSEDDKTNWGNDWQGLQFVVSNGAMPGSSYSYKNANFALLRILIPEIWVAMGTAPYDEVTEGNHSSMYLAYLYQNVLEPAGIYNVLCQTQVNFEEALAYSADFVETGGVSHTKSFNNCGGNGGFRMSAMELARYLAYLQHTTDILNLSQRHATDQGKLGWSDNSGDGFYWHSGAYYSNYVIAAENDSGDLGYALSNEVEYRKSSRACVMKFPYGVEASLLINSEFATGFDGSTCGVLKTAFELFSD